MDTIADLDVSEKREGPLFVAGIEQSFLLWQAR